MAIGTLTTKVVLDSPKRVHCGSTDTVTGHVRLQYTADCDTRQQPSAELFGPLKVIVTLHGRAKTKVYKSNSNSRTTYRGRAPLFTTSLSIHDGPFKSSPSEIHRIPFSISFPNGVSQGQGYWEVDPRFPIGANGDQTLPPTFSIEHRGFTNRFDAFTEYRVGAKTTMAGINLKITDVQKDEEPSVLYEQPRTPVAAISDARKAYNDHFKIQNEFLLPENDRPTGFKMKAKALWRPDYYPEYHFDVSLSVPQHLYIGQAIVCEAAYRPNDKRSTAPIIPEIDISSFEVSLSALTVVRAEQAFLTEPDAEGDDDVFLGGVDFTAGPFSKAEDFSKVIRTRRVLGGIPTTFTAINISRKYRLQVKLTLRGAGKHFDVVKQLPVTVHPPFEDGSTSESVAGPSTVAPQQEWQASGQLPAYDSLEQPPEYGGGGSATLDRKTGC